MKYFLDMLMPPTVDQASEMKSLGWSGCAVYVGGPRAAAHDAWHEVPGQRKPVGDLVDQFEFFVPIWVGRNIPWDPADAFSFALGVDDGARANWDTEACGFGPETPLGLDLEYGTFQAHPQSTIQYVLGWVSKVNEAGHPAGIYSDLASLAALRPGLDVDWKWGAAWVPRYAGEQAPAGQFDPSEPPPWDAWQFAGSTVAGVQCDLNSALDTFIGAHYG